MAQGQIKRSTKRRLWNQDEEEKQYGKTFWLEEEVLGGELYGVKCWLHYAYAWIRLRHFCLSRWSSNQIKQSQSWSGDWQQHKYDPQPIVIRDPVEFMGHQGGRKGWDMKKWLKEAVYDRKEANSCKTPRRKKKKKKWLSLMATEVW